MKHTRLHLCSRKLSAGDPGSLFARRVFIWIAAAIALICPAGLTFAQSALPPPTGLHVVGEVTPLTYAPAPIDNPLKGIAANPSISKSSLANFPHSLQFGYFPLRDTVIASNTYNWAELEMRLNQVTNDGSQLIPRFFIDYPGWTNSALPQYLLDGGLQTWTYTDYGNQYSRFPNYEDGNLQSCLTNFIAAYGRKYDGDPRIAFVEVGTVGLWGEWHYGGVDMLSHWASLAAQSQVLNAYTQAFTKTKLMFRYPAGTNNNAGGVVTIENDRIPAGYYDDSFGRTTLPTDWYNPETLRPPTEQSWYQWVEMRLAGAINKWKYWPNGGELSDAGHQFFYSNAVIYPGQDWNTCVEVTHSTFIHDWAVFYTNVVHLGQEQNAALAGAQRLGYELWVSSFSHWTNATGLGAQVMITNTGVAPFYYKWPVQLAAYNNGQLLSSWSTPWDITTIIPGDGTQTFSTALSNAPPRPFTLLMRAVNPMPTGKQLRFANATQNATLTNWLTLGRLQ